MKYHIECIDKILVTMDNHTNMMEEKIKGKGFASGIQKNDKGDEYIFIQMFIF